MPNATPAKFGSTLLIADAEWNNNHGTHLIRPAIFIKDNGNGTTRVMRATTQQAKRGQQPYQANRRVSPDGAGYGNSFNEFCDLVGGSKAFFDIPNADVICKLGDLSKADAWWVEDQLFA